MYLPFTAEYFLLWYRKDIFDQLGLTAPKTVDELQHGRRRTRRRPRGGHDLRVRVDRPRTAGAGEGGWNLFCTANRMAPSGSTSRQEVQAP